MYKKYITNKTYKKIRKKNNPISTNPPPPSLSLQVSKK